MNDVVERCVKYHGKMVELPYHSLLTLRFPLLAAMTGGMWRSDEFKGSRLVPPDFEPTRTKFLPVNELELVLEWVRTGDVKRLLGKSALSRDQWLKLADYWTSRALTEAIDPPLPPPLPPTAALEPRAYNHPTMATPQQVAYFTFFMFVVPSVCIISAAIWSVFLATRMSTTPMPSLSPRAPEPACFLTALEIEDTGRITGVKYQSTVITGAGVAWSVSMTDGGVIFPEKGEGTIITGVGTEWGPPNGKHHCTRVHYEDGSSVRKCGHVDSLGRFVEGDSSVSSSSTGRSDPITTPSPLRTV
jgi:hypothetical protein